ncbi:MAG: Type 1 glutamine amidotransferase-like domain-containing protein [Vicinamibacteria bacterium]
MRTILALGGHEFSRRRGNEAIRDYMLALADGPAPRVCLLPTASGDPADQIAAFRSSLSGLPCDLSHVSLFRLESEVVEIGTHLLEQDLIYVGGGSMVNLLAIWRAHGIDEILRQCWRRGVVLAGQSAGAMCWFEWGVTRSAGPARLVPGLGLVPGILSVHYHRDPDRRRTLLDAVASRGTHGYGLDDGAGILIRDREVRATLSAHELAAAWRVSPDGKGRAAEERMPAMPLPSPRPAIDELPDEVAELRELRRVAARRGAWSRR